MRHSLNTRLLAAFTIVVIVVIGTVFFFTYLNTRGEISRIQSRLETAQDTRVQLELSRYYQLTGTWDSVQAQVLQYARLYDARIILTDISGTVLADSDGKLTGTKYVTKQPGRTLGSVDVRFPGPGQTYTNAAPSGGTPTPMMVTHSSGMLYVLHNNSQDVARASLQITYKTIGRFFLWGGLLAIAIAIILTFFISRRVLAPVKALTGVTRDFGKGNFSRRVDVNDKGEMGELARSFNAMADDIERNERLRRNMVADIAHELRTPLSNLRGYLEAIGDGLVKPDVATIQSLSDETSSLARLVDDLQELSLADAGELKLVRQPEDIARLINDTVTALQPKALTKEIMLSGEALPGLPRLEIDSLRIKQVLYNLLDNAVAHTGQGGRVTVRAWQEGNRVNVSVADNGEGIPAADLPFIFERFYRVDKSRARATGGTGLGLTIVRRLVEAHGGTIDVKSKTGEGTTFTFSLPVLENPEK